MGNTANHPEHAKEDTPVANKTKDQEASDQIDDTTTKRGDHTSDSSEDGCRPELNADENKSDDQKISREDTDGEVSSVSVERDTTMDIVIDAGVVGAGMRGDERKDTVRKETHAKDEGVDPQDELEQALSLARLSTHAPLLNKNVRSCSRHCSLTSVCSASFTNKTIKHSDKPNKKGGKKKPLNSG